MTQALRESWGSPAVHVPLPSTTAKFEHESTPDEAAGAPQITAKQNWGEPAELPPDLAAAAAPQRVANGNPGGAADEPAEAPPATTNGIPARVYPCRNGIGRLPRAALP